MAKDHKSKPPTDLKRPAPSIGKTTNREMLSAFEKAASRKTK
ncbi:hypothetical protein ACTMTF_15435 [Nonomuraea sp. ZG12]